MKSKRNTITCGKCRKTFPAGSAHNARTCGKKLTPPTPPQPTLTIPPLPTLNVEQEKLTSGEKLSPELVAQGYTLVSTKNSVFESGDDVRTGFGWYQVDEVVQRWEKDGGELVVIRRHLPWIGVEKVVNLLNRLRLGMLVHVLLQVNFFKKKFYISTSYHSEKVLPSGEKEILLHHAHGPAFTSSGQKDQFWFRNKETHFPRAAEKAVRPDLTDEEFYELCTHEDYVVRQLAAHNPECPVEWQSLVDIMEGGSP